MVSEDDLQFQCSTCGHCCSMWRVPVDKARGDALLEKNWVQERLSSYGLSLENQGEAGYRVPLKPDNTCVFLDAEHHCLIQRHEGAAAKPSDCQRFPFAVTRDPKTGATTYDVTAACNSIASELMLSLRPIAPSSLETSAFERYLAEEPPLNSDLSRIIRYPWPLGWHSSLNWDEFNQHLKELRPYFLDESTTVWQVLRLSRAVVFRKNKAANLEPEKFSSKPPAFLSYLQATLLRKPYGNLSRWAVWTGGTYADPRLFGDNNALPLSALKQVHWSAGLGQQHLKALAWLILTRRVALANGQSWLGQLSVAVAGLSLAQWYAKALAWLDDGQNPEVNEAHVVLAIRVVERYYTAHQPNWLALFQAHPVFSWLALWAI